MALKDYIEKAKDYFNLGDEEDSAPAVRPQVVQSQASTQPQAQVRPQVVTSTSPKPEIKSERKQSRQVDIAANTARPT